MANNSENIIKVLILIILTIVVLLIGLSFLMSTEAGICLVAQVIGFGIGYLIYDVVAKLFM